MSNAGEVDEVDGKAKWHMVQAHPTERRDGKRTAHSPRQKWLAGKIRR